MFGHSLRWAVLKTGLITASVLLAVFIFSPSVARAATDVYPFPSSNAGGQQWTKAGSPYVVHDWVYIRYGSLTIDPGVVVKFAPGARLVVHADVPAQIVGTAQEPIYFTSLLDDSIGGDTNGDGAATVPLPGDWAYVDFGGGSTNANLELEYAKFRYGGSVGFGVGNGVVIHPELLLTYWWYNGSPAQHYDLAHIEASHAPTGVLIAMGAASSLTLSNSSFHAASEYGLYTGTGGIDASNNWWGDASGPNFPPALLGSGAQVSGSGITLTTWLSEDPLPDAPIGPLPCTLDCNSNVLFLPGIESSRLYRPDYNGGTDRLWEPGENQDVKDLYLNTNGGGLRDDVYTKSRDVLDENPIGANIYKSFIQRMDSLRTQNKITDWTPVAYDWRLSLDDILENGHEIDGRIYYTGALAATSTPYVIQELRHLARTSRTHKVTIVAHSNGGLLAKRVMEVLGPEGAQLVDKIIFVASPQAGTPHALAAGLHGYKQSFGFGFILNSGVARSFASTSPMFYNLLPSSSYYTAVDDPVARFDTALPEWQATYGSVIHSSPLLRTFITDSFGRVDSESGDTDQPIQLRPDLYDAAQALHVHLDTWAPPAGVSVIQIAGWGVPDTLKGIRYVKMGTGVKPEPDFTVDGDGTVVVPSALLTLNGSNYWMDLDSYNRSRPISSLGGQLSFAYEHSRILETDSVVDFIADILTSTTKPLTAYQYISASSPASSGERLRFSLHSPLTLDMYDALGRHTGVSTTTGRVEEGIPGTYYTEFGDAKYIFAESGQPLKIYMDGYDTGTFTFQAEQLLGDAVVASSTFKDIPTTPEAKVEISTSGTVQALTPLMLDKNGDGNVDAALTPKLNDTVTLDVTPPTTTAVVSGSTGSNGWYTGSVSVTLTAVDIESGVRGTTYSVDGIGTTTGNTVAVSSDGAHIVRYYSEDTAGNVESVQSTPLRIDTLPPEATLSVSTTSKDLLMLGTDKQSATTLTTQPGVTTITDQAGHTTKLTFKKTYAGKYLSYAKLASIKYDSANPVLLPTSFTYLWDANGNPASQTLVVDAQFIVQALYDKSKNRTTIVVLKKNTPIQTSAVSGLAIIKLVTNKGSVSYTW